MRYYFDDFDDYDDDDDFDITDITHLYELRHACNLYGEKHVAKELKYPYDRMQILYESDIDGSEDLDQFLRSSHVDFMKLVVELEIEHLEHVIKMEEIFLKNQELILDLGKARKQFAGIGTNKAKRRLNKLALTNPVAKAVRLALEAEDKSISAKNARGMYKDRIYKEKTKFILSLCEVFKEQNWVYGVQDSDVPPTSHVIYFEIPNCQQISWHFSPEKQDGEFPEYKGEWDQKLNSTLGKLEILTKELLKEEKS